MLDICYKSSETRIRCQNQTSLIRFQKREWDGFEQKPICLLFSFLICAYLPHSPVFFLKQNWCQIFALMWALPQTSWAVRVAGVAPGKLPCESLQPCVKGKHVLHSELQGSLSHLISEMKCFPPPALTIQASALPQTNPSRVACTCDDATMALRKRLFFLRQAPLWVLLVWFADNSHVGEHVVHVCSIYPLIRLQGSALKHASQPSSSCPPTLPVHQIRSPTRALISFHSARPYLVSGICKSVMAPTQIAPNYCLEIWETILLP